MERWQVNVLVGSSRLPLTGQAEGAHPDFMLYVASEDLEEKLHDYKLAMSIVAHILQSCNIVSDVQLSMLSSCVLIDSVSQITSPLKCDYDIPPAIAIIT